MDISAAHLRDAAGTVAVCAFFASSWFGWAQDSPPRGWRWPLTAASLGSILVAIAGGLLTWQRWSDGTALDRETSQAFGIVVGIECVTAGVGAVVLASLRRGALIPVWISFVVGIHFVPLASLFDYPLLYGVAAGVTAVAVAAVPVARSRELEPSFVTGVGTGAVLIVSATASLALLLGQPGG